MWMFITARLRSWLIFAIVLPVVATVVHMVRARLEARSGRTRLVAALTMIENVGKRKAR
jgi:predicted metal-binding membrane protein